ncbi:MAG: YlxR family protein [Pseudobutyrivibrio sp.]|nr:YlxR family protein [Pseudobutyrivibrio sp.]
MNSKNLPLRKCVACAQMLPKDQLFRVVKTSEGISLDLTYKAQGRGAYVCKSHDCIALADKKKSFNRALKCPVSQEVIDSLYRELEND